MVSNIILTLQDSNHIQGEVSVDKHSQQSYDGVQWDNAHPHGGYGKSLTAITKFRPSDTDLSLILENYGQQQSLSTKQRFDGIMGLMTESIASFRLPDTPRFQMVLKPPGCRWCDGVPWTHSSNPCSASQYFLEVETKFRPPDGCQYQCYKVECKRCRVHWSLHICSQHVTSGQISLMAETKFKPPGIVQQLE